MTSIVETTGPIGETQVAPGTRERRDANSVPAPGGLRRRQVTRSVRGRRTVVVPESRLTASDLASRVPYVVVLLLLIGAGVGGTLMLAAQTTQDTYDLKTARDANVELVERMESLQASNERARSAEVLAQRAEQIGMVSVASAPILTRGSDGLIEVVGDSEPSLGAAIKPLQPAPVPSDAARNPDRPVFAAPRPQAPQDESPRGVAPVPYPSSAGLSAPVPPPAPMTQAPSAAPDVQAPPPAVEASPPAAQQDPAPAVTDRATLAPVPGQPY